MFDGRSKLVCSVFVCVFSLVSCRTEKLEYAGDLVGVWELKTTLNTGVVYHESYDFRSDGRFILLVKRVEKSNTNEYEIVGSWHTNGNVIHYVVTHSNHPGVAVGSRDTNEIMQINSSRAVIKDSNGRTTVAMRIR